MICPEYSLLILSASTSFPTCTKAMPKNAPSALNMHFTLVELAGKPIDGDNNRSCLLISKVPVHRRIMVEGGGGRGE